MSGLSALEHYKKALALVPEIELKGKNNLYTSSNGYMFSFVNKDDELGIRLPKDAQAEFLSQYSTGPFKSYGATMRDYVVIPQEILADSQLIARYLKQGFDYVNSLPNK